MFGLIKLYCICPLSYISQNEQGKHFVKFDDKTCCKVDLITTHASFAVLEKLKLSLRSHIPRVVLTKCDGNIPIKVEPNLLSENVDYDTSGVTKLEITSEQMAIKHEQESDIDHNFDNDITMEDALLAGTFISEDPSKKNGENKDLYIDNFESGDLAIVDDDIKNEMLVEETLSDIEDPYSLTDDEDDPNYLPEEAESSPNEDENCDVSESLKLTLAKSRSPQNIRVSSEPSTSTYITHNGVITETGNLSPKSLPLDVYLEANNCTVKASKRTLPRRSNACLFCRKLVSRSTRHMKTVHAKHPRVAAILALPDPTARSEELNKLRREGTFQHNSRVLIEKKGKFIAQRRNNAGPTDQFLPCLNCKQYLKANSFYKHERRCNPNYKRYGRVKVSAALSLPGVVPTTDVKGAGYEILKDTVWPLMKKDRISEVAQNDELIIKWGASYCILRSVKKQRSLQHVVSQKIRLLARLVQELRNKCKNDCTLADFMHPDKFNDIIEATIKLCGQEENGNLKSPSIYRAISCLLLNCAIILRNEGTREGDTNKTDQVKQFLDLHNSEWAKRLDVKVQQQLIEENHKKDKLLPFAEDLITYHKYLFSEEARLVKKLISEGFTLQAWHGLVKILISTLFLFNKCSADDIQKIPLISYLTRTTVGNSADMSKMEQIFAAGYVQIHPFETKDVVIIPTSQVPSYDLMLKLRSDANVTPDNEYLFGKGMSLYFSASYAICQTSLSSGAKKPHLLRSVRKRIISLPMAKVLNFTNEDFKVLASCMGKSIDNHQHFYKIPEDGLHLSTLTQIFTAVCSGKVDAIKGRNLNDFPVPNEETTIEYITSIAAIEGGTNQGDLKGEKSVQMELTAECRIHGAPEDIIHQEICSESIEKNSQTIEAIPQSSKLPVRWTVEKRKTLLKYFERHIQENKIPQKADCEGCKVTYPSLVDLQWKTIKDFVRNTIVSKNKNRVTPKKEPVERVSQSGDDEDNIFYIKVPWSLQQKEAALKYFSEHIETKRIPQKADCENCKTSEPLLATRSWRNIKDFVRNTIVTRNRKRT